MIDNSKKTGKNNTDSKAQTPENTEIRKLDLDELDTVSGGESLEYLERIDGDGDGDDSSNPRFRLSHHNRCCGMY